MRRLSIIARFASGAVLLAGALACVGVGTTGDELITFRAYASGPSDANGGQPCGATGGGTPLTLTALGGYQVTLTSATLQIGAVYLVEGAYNGGSANSECFELGTYCGEVPGGITEVNDGPGLNLLCPDPTEFSVFGNGTADVAGTGQIWLTGGQHTCTASDGGSPLCSASSPDVNALTDATPIVQVTGFVCPPTVTPCTATTNEALSFEATITISEDNRGRPSMPGLPGDNPICLQRIVQLGLVQPLNIHLFQGGNLYVRVDPRGWFDQVDFSLATCPLGVSSFCGPTPVCCGLEQVLPATESAPAVYQIPDTNGSTIGSELFGGVTTGTLPSGVSIYSLEFKASD
jgi:hypothetical protein